MPEPPIGLTTIPIVADLLDDLPVQRWIYYCVDDFENWPGLDQSTMAYLERKLVQRADSIIAVSPALQQRLAQMGRSSHLLTHGVDLEFWTKPQESALPSAVSDLPAPLIVFWGLIDRRLDVSALERLASDLKHGTIVLIGPQQAPDPALRRMKNVALIPAVPFHQLRGIARHAAVLIMPYADMPVTRAMQPLKLKEYLATGKPVVARDLPANRCWADALDLVDSPEQFSETVLRRLITGLPDQQHSARACLTSESWSEKARQLESFLETESGADVSACA